MRCPDCRGLGSWARGEVCGACIACVQGLLEMPCPHHQCKRCQGCGLVCPVCRGDRFVRQDVPVGHPAFGQVFCCDACCEGNGVNEFKERKAIERYLAAYRPDPRSREEIDEERAQLAQARYAEYVRHNGNPRASMRARPEGRRRRGASEEMAKIGDVLAASVPKRQSGVRAKAGQTKTTSGK